MTVKDDVIYCSAILEFIADIELYIAEFSNVDDALADKRNYDAVLRKLQLMAETTQRLSQDIKTRLTNIPWNKIAGFRNILVHDYLGNIDTQIIKTVIIIEIPPLKAAMLTVNHH